MSVDVGGFVAADPPPLSVGVIFVGETDPENTVYIAEMIAEERLLKPIDDGIY